MRGYTSGEVRNALRPIASLIGKSEKAREKLTPGRWQHTMLSENIKALRIASRLIDEEQDHPDEPTPDELEDSLRSLDSMIERTEQALEKFAPGTSQHSLQHNRLKALQIARAAVRRSALDIPRIFSITESAHRIHNPLTPEKLAILGTALRMETGTRVLDLGSGSGEMLCTWARDHGITGTGIDMSPLFTEQARRRAEELDVADRVTFVHDDAAGFIAAEKVDVAACLGATWIGGGVAGTIELLAKSLCPGGIILVGEPFWRQLPPTGDVAEGCLGSSIDDFVLLPELLASFGNLGYDVVEMVLANQDSWDRYEAVKWLTMRRWLEANPDDEFVPEVRAQLTSEPERYARYTREYLGWGVFALMAR